MIFRRQLITAATAIVTVLSLCCVVATEAHTLSDAIVPEATSDTADLLVLADQYSDPLTDAASSEKRAHAAEGSENKLKSGEQAEVTRLKDASHPALVKPVGSTGRTPASHVDSVESKSNRLVDGTTPQVAEDEESNPVISVPLRRDTFTNAYVVDMKIGDTVVPVEIDTGSMWPAALSAPIRSHPKCKFVPSGQWGECDGNEVSSGGYGGKKGSVAHGWQGKWCHPKVGFASGNEAMATSSWTTKIAAMDDPGTFITTGGTCGNVGILGFGPGTLAGAYDFYHLLYHEQIRAGNPHVAVFATEAAFMASKYAKSAASSGNPFLWQMFKQLKIPEMFSIQACPRDSAIAGSMQLGGADVAKYNGVLQSTPLNMASSKGMGWYCVHMESVSLVFDNAVHQIPLQPAGFFDGKCKKNKNCDSIVDSGGSSGFKFVRPVYNNILSIIMKWAHKTFSSHPTSAPQFQKFVQCMDKSSAQRFPTLRMGLTGAKLDFPWHAYIHVNNTHGCAGYALDFIHGWDECNNNLGQGLLEAYYTVFDMTGKGELKFGKIAGCQ